MGYIRSIVLDGCWDDVLGVRNRQQMKEEGSRGGGLQQAGSASTLFFSFASLRGGGSRACFSHWRVHKDTYKKRDRPCDKFCSLGLKCQ